MTRQALIIVVIEPLGKTDIGGADMRQS
jgi:hypothetical protein